MIKDFFDRPIQIGDIVFAPTAYGAGSGEIKIRVVCNITEGGLSGLPLFAEPVHYPDNYYWAQDAYREEPYSYKHSSKKVLYRHVANVLVVNKYIKDMMKDTKYLVFNDFAIPYIGKDIGIT